MQVGGNLILGKGAERGNMQFDLHMTDDSVVRLEVIDVSWFQKAIRAGTVISTQAIATAPDGLVINLAYVVWAEKVNNSIPPGVEESAELMSQWAKRLGKG